MVTLTTTFEFPQFPAATPIVSDDNDDEHLCEWRPSWDGTAYMPRSLSVKELSELTNKDLRKFEERVNNKSSEIKGVFDFTEKEMKIYSGKLKKAKYQLKLSDLLARQKNISGEQQTLLDLKSRVIMEQSRRP